MEVRAPNLGQGSAECWRAPSGLLPDQLYHTSLFRPGENKRKDMRRGHPPPHGKPMVGERDATTCRPNGHCAAAGNLDRSHLWSRDVEIDDLHSDVESSMWSSVPSGRSRGSGSPWYSCALNRCWKRDRVEATSHTRTRCTTGHRMSAKPCKSVCSLLSNLRPYAETLC